MVGNGKEGDGSSGGNGRSFHMILRWFWQDTPFVYAILLAVLVAVVRENNYLLSLLEVSMC